MNFFIYIGRFHSIVIALIVLPLVGCTRIVSGYRFNESRVERVLDGELNTNKTRMAMGRETILESSDHLHEPILIYMSEDTVSYLFIRRQILSRRILMLYYDSRGEFLFSSTKTLKDARKSRMRIIKIFMKKPNKMWALPFYTLV